MLRLAERASSSERDPPSGSLAPIRFASYAVSVLLYDLTLPITRDMPVYEGDPEPSLEQVHRVRPGDPASYNLSRLAIGAHTGTHVDSPRHFRDGGPAVDEIPLDVLCGPCRIVDLRGAGRAIDRGALQSLHLERVQRLLLRTHDGEMLRRPVPFDHAFVTDDAARWLRDSTEVQLIGTDCLSIDPSDTGASLGYPAHRELLCGDRTVVIVEGLDLRSAPVADGILWCLPMRLAADGAPARVVFAMP